VPESGAGRNRRSRKAERRRQAVNMLRITEATCRYAAVQLGNGADPAWGRTGTWKAVPEDAPQIEAFS
jgi:hypothetical protein